MSWFSDFFEKADWRLVKEIQAGYVSYRLDPINTDKHLGESKEEVSYYLYENQFGKRKFDAVDSREGEVNIHSVSSRTSWTFRSQEYRYTIRPWMDGRLDPKIPSYEQAPVNDFHAQLKGKK